jgi:hypothetical protein
MLRAYKCPIVQKTSTTYFDPFSCFGGGGFLFNQQKTLFPTTNSHNILYVSVLKKTTKIFISIYYNNTLYSQNKRYVLLKKKKITLFYLKKQ